MQTLAEMLHSDLSEARAWPSLESTLTCIHRAAAFAPHDDDSSHIPQIVEMVKQLPAHKVGARRRAGGRLLGCGDTWG